MRKIYSFLSFCFIATVSSMILMVSVVKAQDIKWQSYSSAIFDQAKKEHRLVLLYGKSEWCHWCQKMNGETWTDTGVQQLINDHFVPVAVDVTDDAEIANHFQIKGTPTLVIVGANRQVIKTLYGFEEPYDLVNNLTAVLNLSR